MTEHLRHRGDRRNQRVNLAEAGIRFTLGLVIVGVMVAEDLSRFFGRTS